MINLSNKTAYLIFAICLLLAGCLSGGGGGSDTSASGSIGSPGGSPGGSPVCSTTVSGTAGSISISNQVSRTSGVAPLTVFFDASGTTATSTTRPFHDLEYRWNFGETSLPGTGTWKTGSRAGSSSRNQARGPEAAHLFETPGTYTVTLGATDGTNTVSNACTQITVLDPDIVFSGNNTICLSSGGNFTNCPSGAQQVTYGTANITTALSTYVATGKRILIRRGETWTAPTVSKITANGPGILSSFGPKTGGVYDDLAPVIQTSSAALVISSGATPSISDWRITDLTFDGMSSGTSQAISGGGGFNQFTFLRLWIKNQYNGILLFSGVLDGLNSGGSPGHNLWDQISVFDSTIENAFGGGGGYLAFLSAARLAIMGNMLNDATAVEHVLRLPFVTKGVITNNTLGQPAPTKVVIKLHSAIWGTADVTGGGYTEEVIISDNKLIGANTAWTVALEPRNNTNDERLRNILVERNWFVAGTGTVLALRASGQEFTIRNNIFDMSGGTAFRCAEVSQIAVEPPPTDIRYYNNTCYNASVGVTGVKIGGSAVNVSVINNIASAPAGTITMIDGTGASGLISLNNLSDMPTTLFANAAPTIPGDFSLSATSPAINIGTTIPVFSDFSLIDRPKRGNFDAGAFELP